MSTSPSPPRILRVSIPSWMVSAIVHFAIILLMALIALPTAERVLPQTFLVRSTPLKEEIIEDPEIVPVNLNIDLTNVSNSEPAAAMASFSIDNVPTIENNFVDDAFETTQIAVDHPDLAERTAPYGDLLQSAQSGHASGYDSRGKQMQQSLRDNGGNDASQAAVAAALQWLAEHQQADGSWNFDHRGSACQGRCGNPGDMADCKTGATAMALLPFLGAGQTHKEGKYKRNVEAGLYFLTSQMKLRNEGNLATGNLAQGGGQMYAHGLAATALCEAYGMTQDRGLVQPAQAALNYIVYAQDPLGGGWRYTPRQAGDTSVVGWQLMALKSGHLSYLNVPPPTIAGANKFLDSVQTDSGAKYGYTNPGAGTATTAVGLLCRMYLGWKKDSPGIERGVEFLSRTGPSKNNLYYDYYATQVMLHYGGPKWTAWNEELRDWLVATQDKKGHQAGSWYVAGDHGSAHGGRLYCTSLATMILEVYYRISPIYSKEIAEVDFPL